MFSYRTEGKYRHAIKRFVFALAAAIEPYLPIVRTMIVLGGTAPTLRQKLLQRIEAALRAEDG